MPIDITCDGCGARFKAPEAAAGKKGKCKKCGATIAVPKPGPVEVAGPPEDDMYDVVEPAPALAKPYGPAGAGDVAAAKPYNPPPPTAASAAMMARGVVPRTATAGKWKESNNPPGIMKVLGIGAGVVLILLGLLFISGPILAMMSDKTGKTIRFKGVFFGVAMIATGVTAIGKAFGKFGG